MTKIKKILVLTSLIMFLSISFIRLYNQEKTPITNWSYGLSETLHNTTLIPRQYYYPDIFENSPINLKVEFKNENNDFIENAHVYTYNFTGGMQNFTEISGGGSGVFYLLNKFNVGGAKAGNNTLTIYANASGYTNNQVNVIIGVIKATSFIANESILSVSWNENFTIQFNYTEKTSGVGIETTPTNNWLGESHTTMITSGVYIITCNTSLYAVNKTHSLIISVVEFGYEPNEILVKIEITEKETKSIEVNPFLVILSVAGMIGLIGLIGYFIAYQRVLKYPKTIRKIHKVKRTLKRKRTPKIEITSRENAFKEVYEEK